MADISTFISKNIINQCIKKSSTGKNRNIMMNDYNTFASLTIYAGNIDQKADKIYSSWNKGHIKMRMIWNLFHILSSPFCFHISDPFVERCAWIGISLKFPIFVESDCGCCGERMEYFPRSLRPKNKHARKIPLPPDQHADRLPFGFYRWRWMPFKRSDMRAKRWFVAQ